MMLRLLRLAFTVLTLGIAMLPAVKHGARRAIHRLLCVALRLRSRRSPVDHEGGTLVIAPHQDDEALGCGGYMRQRQQSGRSLNVVYITDGRASHPGHPRLTPEDVAALRHSEALGAMRALGLEADALHFLNVADGTLAHLGPPAAEMLVQQLAKILQHLAPAEILLPCRRDGSSEHEATFLLVRRAIASAGIMPRVLEYPIWARWNPLRLVAPLIRSRAVWRLNFAGQEQEKRRALAPYVSQTQPTAPWTKAVLPEGFVAFFSGPEEFFFEE